MLAAIVYEIEYDLLDPKGEKRNGYIGYDEKEGGQWAKFYEISGEDVFDPQKAIIFTVKKSDRGKFLLQAAVGRFPKTLTNNGNWVNFYWNKAKYEYKYVSTGWSPSDKGYASI